MKYLWNWSAYSGHMKLKTAIAFVIMLFVLIAMMTSCTKIESYTAEYKLGNQWFEQQFEYSNVLDTTQQNCLMIQVTKSVVRATGNWPDSLTIKYQGNDIGFGNKPEFNCP